MGLGIFATRNAIQEVFQKRQFNSIVVGLEGAGKSTILSRLNLASVETVPFIGFQVEEVQYRQVTLSCWNSQRYAEKELRQKQYFINIQAVVFVVDSSYNSNMEQDMNALDRLLHEYELQLSNAVLLVLANKQDIAKRLKDKKHQQEVCALSGQGLIEGFTWICNTVSQQNR